MGKTHALLEAARAGNVLEVSKILNSTSSGVNSVSAKVGKVVQKVGVKVVPLLNKTDDNGATALHLAALEGHLDVVKLLLNNGAQISLPDNRNCTVLHYACYRGRAAVLSELIAHARATQAAVTTSYANFQESAYRANNRTSYTFASPLNTLLDVNGQNADGETALHVAATFNHVKCVELLLESGANVLLVSQNDETPLGTAVRNGHLLTANTLAAHIPLTVKRIRKFTGQSVLHEAVKRGELRMLRMLLDCGFDVNATNEFGTPLHMAVLCRKPDAFALLLATGSCDTNVRDNDSKTVNDLLCEAQVASPTTSASSDSVRQMMILLEAGVEAARRRVNADTLNDDASASQKPGNVLLLSEARSRAAIQPRPPRPATMITTKDDTDALADSAKATSIRHEKVRNALETNDAATKRGAMMLSRVPEQLSSVNIHQAEQQLQPEAVQKNTAIRDLDDVFGSGPALNHGDFGTGVLQPTVVTQKNANNEPPVPPPKAKRQQRPCENGSLMQMQGTQQSESVAMKPPEPAIKPKSRAPRSPPKNGSPVKLKPKPTGALPSLPPRCPPPPTGPRFASNVVPVSDTANLSPPKLAPKPLKLTKWTKQHVAALLDHFPCLTSSADVREPSVSTRELLVNFCGEESFVDWFASERGSLLGWLTNIGLSEHEDAFIAAGFNSLYFINGVYETKDLCGILPGITQEQMETIALAISRLPNAISERPRQFQTILDWLTALELDELCGHTFVSRYSTVTQFRTILPSDLLRLGVQLVGHRRRILESLYAAKDKSGVTQSQSTSTPVRHSWWPFDPIVLIRGYYPFQVVLISAPKDDSNGHNCTPALLFVSCKLIKYFDASDCGTTHNSWPPRVLLSQHLASDVTDFSIAESQASPAQSRTAIIPHLTFVCSYRLVAKDQSFADVVPRSAIANSTIQIGATSKEQCLKVAKTFAQAYDLSDTLFNRSA